MPPPSLAKILKTLPPSAGVYLFYGASRNPIYIGKAKNLRARVRSYFRKGISPRGTKFGLQQEIKRVNYEILPSDVAAFIREAELIKRFRPKYNVLMRDDKNYGYVGFSVERFPKIFLTHQPTKCQRSKVKCQMVGPFTSMRSLKTALASLRRLFPYCICKKPHRGNCLNYNLGLCYGWCCAKNASFGQEEIKKYAENIKRIKLILLGKSKAVIKNLERAMKDLAGKEKFEEAARIRDAFWSLQNIFEHREVIKAQRLVDTQGDSADLSRLLGVRKPIYRIEGYDISDIRGKSATGAMVVFVHDRPFKPGYRKFRIKTVDRANDPAMLAEVLSRRIEHKEWPMPDLILLDGGKGQLGAVAKILKKKWGRRALPFAVAALAKHSRSLYTANRKAPVMLAALPQKTSFLLERVRDEAHRFARAYHHWLRAREIVS